MKQEGILNLFKILTDKLMAFVALMNESVSIFDTPTLPALVVNVGRVGVTFSHSFLKSKNQSLFNSSRMRSNGTATEYPEFSMFVTFAP